MAEQDREKWDEFYRDGKHGDPAAPTWLDEFAADLPTEGRALDVAAGAGAVSLYLRARGLEVTAVDISPIGLDILKHRAQAQSATGEMPEIRTRVLDLEVDPLPEGGFDLIACFHYLQRSLFPDMIERLAPKGVFVFEHPTVKNLERHERPGRHYLLEPQEVLGLIGPMRIVHYREGWIGDHHLARVVARRPK